MPSHKNNLYFSHRKPGTMVLANTMVQVLEYSRRGERWSDRCDTHRTSAGGSDALLARTDALFITPTRVQPY